MFRGRSASDDSPALVLVAEDLLAHLQFLAEAFNPKTCPWADPPACRNYILEVEAVGEFLVSIDTAEEGGVVFRLPALPDPVAPEEVSAAVLRALLDDAERATGVRAERAVITVRQPQPRSHATPRPPPHAP